MNRVMAFLVMCGAIGYAAARAEADATVTVDPDANWLGFMNVSELPENGGAFVFGQGWGTADLVATFDGPVLSLSPNTIGDPAEFWYVGGGGPGAQGNKIMEANMYIEETDTLNGMNVTFIGDVLSNTLVDPYTSVAFIRDFAPDYSTFNEVTTPLVPGEFSITLATDPGAGRHIQYGFTTTGPNVWITDVEPLGSAEIVGIPEPASVALVGIACVGMAGFIRRRRNC